MDAYDVIGILNAILLLSILGMVAYAFGRGFGVW